MATETNCLTSSKSQTVTSYPAVLCFRACLKRQMERQREREKEREREMKERKKERERKKGKGNGNGKGKGKEKEKEKERKRKKERKKEREKYFNSDNLQDVKQNWRCPIEEKPSRCILTEHFIVFSLILDRLT